MVGNINVIMIEVTLSICLPLSPRPHKLTKTSLSLPKLLAISIVWYKACEGSNAGIIPIKPLPFKIC